MTNKNVPPTGLRLCQLPVMCAGSLTFDLFLPHIFKAQIQAQTQHRWLLRRLKSVERVKRKSMAMAVPSELQLPARAPRG